MDDREHTEHLIATYQRRLRVLEVKQAQFGWEAPASVIMEIEEIQEKLGALRQRLGQPVLASVDLRELATETQRPPKYRGLMLLVGAGRVGEDPLRQSAGAALAYHFGDAPDTGLERCWLIPSGIDADNVSQPNDPNRAAIDVARELARRCAERGVQAGIWPVAEPFSAQATYDLVRWLFSHEVPAAGFAEHEVICDFTGGTKLMSAGMILACGTSRPMQYMVRKAGQESAPLSVRFASEDRQ